MFDYSHRSGTSSVARSRTNESLMGLGETLACFGAVIGMAILIYLLCRWCQYVDAAHHTQEHRNEQRDDFDESTLDYSNSNYRAINR